MKDILDKYNKNIKVIICSYNLNLNLNLSWEITGCVSSNSFTAFYTKSKNHLGRTSGFRKPVCCSRLSETQEVETGTQWNNHILCCVGPLTVFSSFAVQQNDNSSGDSLQLAVQRISKNSKELQQEVEGIFNTEWLSRFVVVGETNQGHVNLILQGWQAKTAKIIALMTKTSLAIAKSQLDFTQTSSTDRRCEWIFPHFRAML